MRLARGTGYEIIVDPVNGTKEADTITCFHCQRIVSIGGGVDIAEVTGGCYTCGKFICLPCVDLGVCTPWEKTMERMEARDRFLRSAGINE